MSVLKLREKASGSIESIKERKLIIVIVKTKLNNKFLCILCFTHFIRLTIKLFYQQGQNDSRIYFEMVKMLSNFDRQIAFIKNFVFTCL